MYTFGRLLHVLLCGLAVQVGLGLIEGNGHRNAVEQHPGQMTAQAKTFSRQWAEEYDRDELGCDMGRGSYTWRGSGFGSNVNHLLNAWVYTLAAEGWSDLSLLIENNQLRGVECSDESNGLVSRGWSCLFGSMPHLCVFDTPEMWQRHMNSSGVSLEDQTEAAWFSLTSIASADFSTPLKVLGVDQLRAKSVMAKILWKSMTPWLRRDVHTVTHAQEIFHKSPFVAIHVRRGDKIRQNGSLWQDTEAYLAAALRYLESQATRPPADRIKGIWVASDDENVVNEVRYLANAYFPNVRNENIVYVAGGVPGGVQIPDVTTVSIRQVYASFVYLMADFEQLAAADVFVGTFSSNVGRLVMLLREGAGKARSSCISLDSAWKPNRKRSLELD